MEGVPRRYPIKKAKCRRVEPGQYPNTQKVERGQNQNQPSGHTFVASILQVEPAHDGEGRKLEKVVELPPVKSLELGQAITDHDVATATALLKEGVTMDKKLFSNWDIRNFWSAGWTTSEIVEIEDYPGFQSLFCPGLGAIKYTENVEQAKWVVDYCLARVNVVTKGRGEILHLVGSDTSHWEDNTLAEVIQYALSYGIGLKGAVLGNRIRGKPLTPEEQLCSTFIGRLLYYHPTCFNALKALLYSPDVDPDVAANFPGSPAANIITKHIELFRIRHSMPALQAYFGNGHFDISEIQFLDWLAGYGEFQPDIFPEVLALCKTWIGQHGNQKVLHREAIRLGLFKIAKIISGVSMMAYPSDIFPHEIMDFIQELYFLP